MTPTLVMQYDGVLLRRPPLCISRHVHEMSHTSEADRVLLPLLTPRNMNNFDLLHLQLIMLRIAILTATLAYLTATYNMHRNYLNNCLS